MRLRLFPDTVDCTLKLSLIAMNFNIKTHKDESG
ncbi:MAG: hypothetical protein KatS3mg031_2549 [Chitinophagales bacterium]|nr:MAG: hypothetical protein KatS3mg031_2549 [Chitinophagales bacterium]